MSLRPSPDLERVVATRLRAVGCVFAEDEARLLVSEAGTPEELADLLDRRARGLPLEQVLGWADFCGTRVTVEPGVFVPRRRTELLVHEAAELLRGRAGAAGPGSHASGAVAPRPVVVDLCCGSGAVGAALDAALDGHVELHSVDIDPAAVRCALRNLAPSGRAYVGDLYDPLPSGLRGRIDVLLANAPYVPTHAIQLMPPEARVHEPHVALDGGADGLDVQRRVVAAAPLWLAPGGHLLVETGEHQAPQTVDAFARACLVPRVARSAELDATVVIGTASSVRGASG